MILSNLSISTNDLIYHGGILISKYWDETPIYKHIPYSLASTTEFLHSFLSDEDGYLYVHMRDDRAIAMLAAITTPTFFNSSYTVLENILTYVDEEHRGSIIGPRMIKEMIKWGEWKGAKHAHISTISGIGSERTTKLYEKLGFTIVGSTASMPIGE